MSIQIAPGLIPELIDWDRYLFRIHFLPSPKLQQPGTFKLNYEKSSTYVLPWSWFPWNDVTGHRETTSEAQSSYHSKNVGQWHVPGSLNDQEHNYIVHTYIWCIISIFTLL